MNTSTKLPIPLSDAEVYENLLDTLEAAAQVLDRVATTSGEIPEVLQVRAEISYLRIRGAIALICRAKKLKEKEQRKHE